MKNFIIGYMVTLGLYLGIAIGLMFGIGYVEGINLFADGIAQGVARFFYSALAQPTVTNITSEILTLELGLMSIIGSILWICFYILPVMVACIVGSYAARKSGKTSHIFASTFLGLLTAVAIGIIIQVLTWPELGNSGLWGTSTYLHWEWFIPGAITISMFNTFFWSSVGLLITAKVWD